MKTGDSEMLCVVELYISVYFDAKYHHLVAFYFTINMSYSFPKHFIYTSFYYKIQQNRAENNTNVL